MKNVEQNENSPVEIIYERLNRFHTNEIDAQKRLRLQEKKGWEGGKTKATWKGKSTNILKRKHRLKSLRKESKDFTRVGWILFSDSGSEKKKGWAGGKRKQLRIEFGKDEEARVNLTRNAQDKRGWTTHETNHVILKKNLSGKRSSSKHQRQDSSPERRSG